MNHVAIDRALDAWLGLRFPSAPTAFFLAEFARDRDDAYCHRCGATFGVGEVNRMSTRGAQLPCASCRTKPRSADMIVRVGEYNRHLREWITAGKYHRWTDMLESLGDELGKAVAHRLQMLPARQNLRKTQAHSDAQHIDNVIVTPVPMPWARRVARGVDHARVLAEHVGRQLGKTAEVVPMLRKQPGLPQVALDGAARRARRPVGWIQPARRAKKWRLDGMTVVLVDDVLTSGTTLQAAGGVLRGMGATRIIAAVVAVTRADGRRSQDEQANPHEATPVCEWRGGQA
ncbi:MAG: ComF family protein [Phycisphaerales bacterium]